MVFFAARYKVVKEEVTQSEEGTPITWTYFSAMDDLLPRQPAVAQEVVELVPDGTLYVVGEVFSL